jgi:pimeloyl-ACP methyl ester carboxylesterase
VQPPNPQRFRLSSGTELSFITAGDPAKPAVLLIHGYPNSSQGFRDVIPALSEVAFVIAPDLPGHGGSDPMPTPTFPGFGEAFMELLAHLDVGSRYLYVHDWGAPPALHIAMAEPEKVLGLIIQNANAHESGFGPLWTASKAFWADPSPQNERAATRHLTFEGTRDQYVAGVPPDVVARMSPEHWEQDWRVLNLPGRMQHHIALLLQYGRYAQRFGEIAKYLKERQPPALMLWGRHDAFFDIAETLSWLKDLPRMEAHIFDAGHLMLETHSKEAARLMVEFIGRTQRTQP